MSQIPINVGDANYDPLFKFGYGFDLITRCLVTAAFGSVFEVELQRDERRDFIISFPDTRHILTKNLEKRISAIQTDAPFLSRDRRLGD
jgi:hypothetical protein